VQQRVANQHCLADFNRAEHLPHGSDTPSARGILAPDPCSGSKEHDPESVRECPVSRRCSEQRSRNPAPGTMTVAAAFSRCQRIGHRFPPPVPAGACDGHADCGALSPGFT
jgi:hypothetical protein